MWDATKAVLKKIMVLTIYNRKNRKKGAQSMISIYMLLRKINKMNKTLH